MERRKIWNPIISIPFLEEDIVKMAGYFEHANTSGYSIPLRIKTKRCNKIIGSVIDYSVSDPYLYPNGIVELLDSYGFPVKRTRILNMFCHIDTGKLDISDSIIGQLMTDSVKYNGVFERCKLKRYIIMPNHRYAKIDINLDNMENDPDFEIYDRHFFEEDKDKRSDKTLHITDITIVQK